MTVSSHKNRPARILRCFLSLRLAVLRCGQGRLLLPVILAVLVSMPYAIADDAIDREHAIEIAKEQNGGDGKVLGVATTTDSAGNTQYAVKLLTNGRVRVFTIKGAP